MLNLSCLLGILAGPYYATVLFSKGYTFTDMCDSISVSFFAAVPLILFLLETDSGKAPLPENGAFAKEQIPLALAKCLVMFSTGLKDSILQPLLINYYGHEMSAVPNVLALELFSFAITSLFVGIIPVTRRHHTYMALLACLICCLSLPITGLSDITGMQVERKEALYYITIGIACTGVAQALVNFNVLETGRPALLSHSSTIGLLVG